MKIPRVVLAILLSSCATEVVGRRFNESEVQWFKRPGDSTIFGEAFMRTREGKVVTCAGNSVQLIPESSYARERMIYRFGSS